jgi:hypothetical protein
LILWVVCKLNLTTENPPLPHTLLKCRGELLCKPASLNLGLDVDGGELLTVAFLFSLDLSIMSAFRGLPLILGNPHGLTRLPDGNRNPSESET